jgi:hypothetical protein
VRQWLSSLGLRTVAPGAVRGARVAGVGEPRAVPAGGGAAQHTAAGGRRRGVHRRPAGQQHTGGALCGSHARGEVLPAKIDIVGFLPPVNPRQVTTVELYLGASDENISESYEQTRLPAFTGHLAGSCAALPEEPWTPGWRLLRIRYTSSGLSGTTESFPAALRCSCVLAAPFPHDTQRLPTPRSSRACTRRGPCGAACRRRRGRRRRRRRPGCKSGLSSTSPTRASPSARTRKRCRCWARPCSRRCPRRPPCPLLVTSPGSASPTPPKRASCERRCVTSQIQSSQPLYGEAAVGSVAEGRAGQQATAAAAGVEPWEHRVRREVAEAKEGASREPPPGPQ